MLVRSSRMMMNLLRNRSLMKKSICIFCVTLFLLLPGGCKKSKLKGLVPGSGTITLNGEPVEDAMIVFSPIQSGAVQRSASAKSGTNGNFNLLTLEPDDGVYPGEYKVIVKKTKTTGTNMVLDPDDRRNPAALDDRVTVHLLPRKYSESSMTDLTVTIPAKGNKSIQLQLEGEVDMTPVPRNVRR